MKRLRRWWLFKRRGWHWRTPGQKFHWTGAAKDGLFLSGGKWKEGQPPGVGGYAVFRGSSP